MTRRARLIAAAAFFLTASALGGFFSCAGLEAANKWSSIISTFVALASLTLSTLLFQQVTTRGPHTPPAPKNTPLSNHPAAIHNHECLYTSNKSTCDTTTSKYNNDDKQIRMRRDLEA
jgi:hypothetical protein